MLPNDSQAFDSERYFSGPVSATVSRIIDGDTFEASAMIWLDQQISVRVRIAGIDAPELDQICVDDHADPWACGVEARDRLARLTAKREVRCRDLGADPTTGKRRIGICTVDGETASSAEMVAGALKDNQRGRLVGKTTFGKGSIQKVRKLGTIPPAGLRMILIIFCQ